MKEKYEPKYCIVTGNLNIQEWNKDDIDKDDDSENEMDLIKLKDNNKNINFDEIIRGIGYTTYI